jgi:hypothetical protein
MSKCLGERIMKYNKKLLCMYFLQNFAYELGFCSYPPLLRNGDSFLVTDLVLTRGWETEHGPHISAELGTL